MNIFDLAGAGKTRLRERCAERLEFFLRMAEDQCFRARRISVEFTVERNEEMMFLAVWRGEPTSEGWRKYPAFGLMFNPYMSTWAVWTWSEEAEFWDEADMPYDYGTLDDAYGAARRRGLLWARPDWQPEKEPRAKKNNEDE